jgi:glutamate/tyrosine decarboxylase-like PLP-dependent enzyme
VLRRRAKSRQLHRAVIIVFAMRAQDVRLAADAAARLRRRVEELAPLGTLRSERAPVSADDRAALLELAERLRNNYPYPEPTYAGQMLKPPVPVAWAAYAAAMLINPNNHALDGGPATAELEREAVREIAAMFGLSPYLGHLSASGTIANLEALWVARELRPDAAVLSGANAHYTHKRMCRVIGARHETIPEDGSGRLDLGALEARLKAGGVGTVVATVGTTALGALDDAETIAQLCSDHGVRLHVDAAYGGFFALLADGGEPGVAAQPFTAIRRADSVVIDPHKHGLQPYGCGCVLFADPGVGSIFEHDSPYTYFTSDDLHPGEITLECSRAGASAAALWTTLKALPLTRDGLGSHVGAARQAALELAGRIEADDRLALVVEPELDIVCVIARVAQASEISAASDRAFAALAADGWHVAKLRLNSGWLQARHHWIETDAADVTAIRCCLIKKEHLEVVDALADALGVALTG